MNRIKAVLQSKSANAPPRRGAHKKSWSSGEVSRLASKKRGVYVEHLHPNSTAKGAAGKHPVVAKRPPKNQKEFLNSVLTILSQETAGTQFPEQNAKEPPQAHRRLRIRRRLPVSTADTGTQDLDAVYNDVSPPGAPDPPALKAPRKKRFRSRALNSNLHADIKLEEPEPVTESKKPSNPVGNTSVKSITITKAVLDGQMIIDSKHNQGQSTPAESRVAVAQPATTVIATELEKPEAPPADNPPGEKPKSKVRILEPLKAYEDERFERPVDTIEVNSSYQRSATNTGISRTSFDDYYKSNLRKTRVQESMRRGEGGGGGGCTRGVYRTVPVIDVDDYGDNELNGDAFDNVEVYTAVPRMPNRPAAGFNRPYENYARVCHLRSQSFNQTRRKQFEVRQSRPTRTRVYTNQDQRRPTKHKNKGRDHPLLELLKKELTLEPDWFVEPPNMHEALLKVMEGRKRARESIKFDDDSVGFKYYDQSECMVKGKQRRVIPARRQVYKPKAVGHAKAVSGQYRHQQLRWKMDESDSVIRTDYRTEEEFNMLYHSLDAPPSLTVQNYDFYRSDNDTPLQRIYLSGQPDDNDSISSKDMVPQQQAMFINKIENSAPSSAVTSDTTLRLIMTPQALDYNMDEYDR